MIYPYYIYYTVLFDNFLSSHCQTLAGGTLPSRTSRTKMVALKTLHLAKIAQFQMIMTITMTNDSDNYNDN